MCNYNYLSDKIEFSRYLYNFNNPHLLNKLSKELLFDYNENNNDFFISFFYNLLLMNPVKIFKHLFAYMKSERIKNKNHNEPNKKVKL